MRLALVALLLAACAHVQTAPAICFADPEPAPGSCGALYDAQGRACVVCAQDAACVDADTDTYCVATGLGCDDPACGARK